mgnify:CR=1 FL=1
MKINQWTRQVTLLDGRGEVLFSPVAPEIGVHLPPEVLVRIYAGNFERMVAADTPLAVTGLIAKNGILIVEFANQLRAREGLDKRAAVFRGC